MVDHIVIGDATPRISYVVGSTPQTVFDVDFPFFEDEDLAVYVDGALKVLATDYTVTGAGDSGGGTVTFVAGQANCGVAIVRDVPIARTTDYPTSGPFQIPALNTDLDRLTAWAQEHRARLDRCIRPPDSDPDGLFLLPSVSDRANRFLGFDAAGLPVGMVSASGYPASVYGADLISAANAAAARTALGMTTAGQDLVTAASLDAQRAILGNPMRVYAAGVALPTSNIGPIWHADYAAVMTWQVYSANGASFTGYASENIGDLLTPGGSTARTGLLKANGADLSTTTYARLYNWAKHNGLVVASGDWTAGMEKYRENGGGTFRLPDLRGRFLRVWADGGSIDSGRAFGTTQTHMIENHAHTVNGLSLTGVLGAEAGTGWAPTTLTTSNPSTGTAGAETRPLNTAVLVAIKF